MSDEVRARRLRLARGLAAGGLAWSVGLLVTALLAPAYNDQTISNGNGLTLTSATFVQVNGAWVLMPLAVPLIASLTVLGLLAARRPSAWGWAAVAVVLALGLASIITVGALLLPGAALLALALRVVPAAPAQAGSASADGGGADPVQSP